MTNEKLPDNIQRALHIDREIRKLVSEYYVALKNMHEPAKAVELLAEHVAIMVEMINDIKGGLK